VVPPVLLSREVIGVGVDEQLFEHRVHDVPPQAGEKAGAGRLNSGTGLFS
jgi:hypothetical protein